MTAPAASVTKLPKLNIDALFAIQKANLSALHEAQSVVVDAAQAIAKSQQGWVEEIIGKIQATLSATELKKPEAAVADAKAAAEKAVALTQQNVQLGVAAQKKVVDLLTHRAAATFDEVRALAA